MGIAINSRLEEHLWYLSEEFVVFSLFSKKVSRAQKNKCRQVMLTNYTDNPEPIKGKLITPITSDLKSVQISKLFGRESWRLLRACGIEGKSFLQKAASDWESCDEFKKLQNVVSNFAVVNDVAERAVLLAKTLQNKLTKNPKIKASLVNTIPEL